MKKVDPIQLNSSALSGSIIRGGTAKDSKRYLRSSVRWSKPIINYSDRTGIRLILKNNYDQKKESQEK